MWGMTSVAQSTSQYICMQLAYCAFIYFATPIDVHKNLVYLIINNEHDLSQVHYSSLSTTFNSHA